MLHKTVGSLNLVGLSSSAIGHHRAPAGEVSLSLIGRSLKGDLRDETALHTRRFTARFRLEFRCRIQAVNAATAHIRHVCHVMSCHHISRKLSREPGYKY